MKPKYNKAYIPVVSPTHVTRRRLQNVEYFDAQSACFLFARVQGLPPVILQDLVGYVFLAGSFAIKIVKENTFHHAPIHHLTAGSPSSTTPAEHVRNSCSLP
jgi:hypothetical protein